MSFYLQMLREEEEFMGNTGFDPDMIGNPDGKDKYEVEIQDVADVIEDINADYADQSAQEELDGQDLAEDPVNECMIAIYESEHNWNQIMQTIGSREVLEAARGREMVMEAVDIKGWLETAKNFFVKMWKKFTAIVKNWIDNAMAKFRTNKSFIEKYGSKLVDGQKAYNASSDKKQFKGYNFKADKDFATKVANNVVKIANTNVAATEKWAREVISALNKDYDFSGFDDKVLDPSGFRAALLTADRQSAGVSADGFRKELKKKYFGSEEKVTLNEKSMSPDTLKAVLSSGNKDIADIKKVYKECKKTFDKTIKALNDLQKAMGKTGDASTHRSEAMNTVNKMISSEKECKNALSLSSSMLMKAIHAQKAQARKVANAYIYALNKKTRKGKIDAADGKTVAESGFFGALDLI